MPHSPHRQPAPRERGAITVIVVLMLLLLLTVSAIGMSKNATRSAIAAGTMRQVSQAENTADAGLEWAVYWLAPDYTGLRATATGAALALQNQSLALTTAAQFGQPASTVLSNTSTSTNDMTVATTGNVKQTFDVSLTLMGQVTPPLQGLTPGQTSATAFSTQTLNLWAIVCNGYLTYNNGPVFTHRREVWVTTPPN